MFSRPSWLNITMIFFRLTEQTSIDKIRYALWNIYQSDVSTRWKQMASLGGAKQEAQGPWLRA